MLDSLIGWYVSRKLREVLGGFTITNLDVGIRQGKVVLDNIVVTPDETSGWGLPVGFKLITIGHLEVLLPWRGGSEAGSASVVVRLERVEVVLLPRHAVPHDAEQQRRWQKSHKARLLRTADGAADGPEQGHGGAATQAPLDGPQQQALIDMLLRNLTVSMHDVVVSYEEGAGRPSFRAHLDSLQLHCERENELPRLFALCVKRRESQEQRCNVHFEMVAGLTWHDPRSTGGSSPRRVLTPILKPVTVKANVGMGIRWPSTLKEADAAAAAETPLVLIDGGASVSELRVSVSASQLESLLLLVHRAQHAPHFERYKALRPPMPVSEDAAAWWRYASRAVLHDLGDRRQRESWRSLKEHARVQAQYEAALVSSGWHLLPTHAAPPDLPLLQDQLDVASLLESHARVRAGAAARASDSQLAPGAAPARSSRSGGGGGGLETANVHVSLHAQAGGVQASLPLSASLHPVLVIGPIAIDVDADRRPNGRRGPEHVAQISAGLQSLEVFCAHGSDYSSHVLHCKPTTPPSLAPRLLSKTKHMTPAMQVTSVIELAGEEAQVSASLGVCVCSPLTIAVDAALVHAAVDLASRCTIPSPAVFGAREGVSTAALPVAGIPPSRPMPAEPTATAAAVAMRGQLDVMAPITVTATVFAAEQRQLAVPVVHLPRIHAHLSPPSIAADDESWRVMLRLNLTISLAEQNLLLPSLGYPTANGRQPTPVSRSGSSVLSFAARMLTDDHSGAAAPAPLAQGKLLEVSRVLLDDLELDCALRVPAALVSQASVGETPSIRIVGTLPALRVHAWPSLVPEALSLVQVGSEEVLRMELHGDSILQKGRGQVAAAQIGSEPMALTLPRMQMHVALPTIAVHVHSKPQALPLRSPAASSASLLPPSPRGELSTPLVVLPGSPRGGAEQNAAADQGGLVSVTLDALQVQLQTAGHTIEAAAWLKSLVLRDDRAAVPEFMSEVVHLVGTQGAPLPSGLDVCLQGADAEIEASSPPTCVSTTEGPLLSAHVAQNGAARLDAQILLKCPSVGLHYNPGLVSDCVLQVVDMVPIVSSALQRSAEEPAQSSLAPVAPLATKVNFFAEVDAVVVHLNVDPVHPLSEGAIYETFPANGEVVREPIVLLQTEKVTAAVTQDDSNELLVVLGAHLRQVRGPTSQSPTAPTFAMVRPIASDAARADVTLERGQATQGALEVQVNLEPVFFEFRNQALLRAVEFIDRAIIRPTAPLMALVSPGGTKKRPLVHIRVPRAILSMPSAKYGAIEAECSDAFVGIASALHPIRMDLITVKAKQVRTAVTRGSDSVRSALPLLEELPEVELTLRKPLNSLEAAAAGVPFQDLEIGITRHTLHVGMQPADLAMLMGVWFDNLNVSPQLPANPNRKGLDPNTTYLAVHVKVSQVLIWVHRDADSEAIMRLEVAEPRVEVAKAISGRTSVNIGVAAVASHAAIQCLGKVAWFQQLGPVLAPCTMASGRRSSPSRHAEAAPSGSPANPVQIEVYTGGGEPERVVVQGGSQCLVLHLLPLVDLADFGLAAAVDALALLRARNAPAGPGQTVSVAASVQICVPEPSRWGDQDGAPCPFVPCMSGAAVSAIRPRLLVMHFEVSVEVSKTSAGQAETGAPSGRVQQVAMELSHEHSCLSIGYFDAGPELRLLTPPCHRRRAEGDLYAVTVLPSAHDEQPCLLERFAMTLGVMKRPGQQQIAISVLDPLCISVSLQVGLVFYSILTRSMGAIEAKLAEVSLPEDLGPPAERLNVLASCPLVQLTVLSSEVPALPLIQVVIGTEETPLCFVTEQQNLKSPAATEAAVPVLVQWYNLALFGWEPLVEPFDVLLSARSGQKSAVDVRLPKVVEINISNVILCTLLNNLKAAKVAHDALLHVPEAERAGGRCTTPPPRDERSAEVPHWIDNQTGESFVYWSEGEENRVTVEPGESRLLECADTNLNTGRDWHEDAPRTITVQLLEWRPLHGVVVNQTGTSVLPLERHDASAPTGMLQLVPRSVVCDVDLYGDGTRLTVRSMLTVINHTKHEIAVDVETLNIPLLHLGMLPASGCMAVPNKYLNGGLRFTDVGTGDVSQKDIAAALDAADTASALGQTRPHAWLPVLMSHVEQLPDAQGQAQWRALSDRPEHEFLVRTFTCSLQEKHAVAGELYVGSDSLYFRGSKQGFGKSADRLEVSLQYASVTNLTKKSGKMSGSKGIVLQARGEPSQLTFVNFTAANQARHVLEVLIARCSPDFELEQSEENVKLRQRFRLEHSPHEVVLHEYACALVHAEGSSKGKLYVTQHNLCFSGSLFGKDTRAVYAMEDVVSLELTDSPAPNSITVTSTTTEERFTFLSGRHHALQAITQLLTVTRSDHLLQDLGREGHAPQEPAELPPTRFLEKPKQPSPPHALLPLTLYPSYQAAATCWRYPVKAPISTGTPCTMLLQVPAAVQNLLPYPLEWRAMRASGKTDVEVAHHTLSPNQMEDLKELVWGERYRVQLRMPGYEWSPVIEVDPEQTSDRLQTLKLKSCTHGIKTLRLFVQHRSTCACAYHLMQVYVTHWLENGTGLTLQFKVGKKLTTDDESQGAEAFNERASEEDEGEVVAGDQQTLMFSAKRRSKHLIAVRVIDDAISRQVMAGGESEKTKKIGWSHAFSLLLSPSIGGPALHSLRAGAYDLGVSIATLENADHGRIRVVSFVQRFWLTNRLQLALEFEQWSTGEPGMGQSFPYAAGERAPFHWPKAREDSLLRVRPVPGQGGFLPQPSEGWSSGFPIDSPGHFVIFCEQGIGPGESGWWESLLRIQVTVELVEARIEISLDLAEPAPPPYRIDNQTSYVLLARQMNVERSKSHRILARSEAPFAWPENSLDHVLLVSLTPSMTGTELICRPDPSAGALHSTELAPLVVDQPVKLDAMAKFVPLGSSKKEKEPTAWCRVVLMDGVRVLTIVEKQGEAATEETTDDPHLFIGVQISGVGISVVDVHSEELVYISASDITVDVVRSEKSATLELTLRSFQVDNQQQSATLPAVVSLVKESSATLPAVHVSVLKQLRQAGGAVDWWDYVSVRLLELDVSAEPPFVQALLDFAVASRLPELVVFLMEATAGVVVAAAKPAPATATKADLLRYGTTRRMQYFQRLELHPVKLYLTFQHNETWSDAGWLPIPHIHAAPICLSSLVREHLYGTVEDLGMSIGKHYAFSIMRQLHRVVLQLDMLGDPVGFVRTLGTGVKDLFYLPAKAVVKSPRSLGKAVAAGGKSFAKNTLIAPVNTINKWVGVMERNTNQALVALDMASSQSGPATHRGGKMLLQGTAGLGKGVLKGVAGLVTEPVKGARKGGASGFATGVGKGLMGAAMHPTAGVLQFTSRATDAMRNLGGESEEKATHSARVGRQRPPRMLHGPRHRIAPYEISEALAKHVLQSAGEGKYLQEQLLHCELIQAEPDSKEALVVVLTGMRLLCVNSSTWRQQLHVPLRKVHMIRTSDDEVLLLLTSRKGGGKDSVPVGEPRRLKCHSTEVATSLSKLVDEAVAATRERQTVWTTPKERTKSSSGRHSRSLSARSRFGARAKASFGAKAKLLTARSAQVPAAIDAGEGAPSPSSSRTITSIDECSSG